VKLCNFFKENKNKKTRKEKDTNGIIHNVKYTHYYSNVYDKFLLLF